MQYKVYFHNELRRQYASPETSGRLCADIEEHYQRIFPDVAFARTSANPVDRRLDFAAYFLATIQALESHGESFERIREICLNITHEYVRPKNGFHAWIKRLPVRAMRIPFLLGQMSRMMSRKAGRRGHADGFLVRIITDPAQTHGLRFGFDILECGICKLFAKHKAAKYAGILCEVDKLTSSLAGLELIRGGTLANGAPICDFRFKILK
jgi:hypothetical protein